MRKAATALVIAAGSGVGAALWRRTRGRQTRVDLYFTDGSMVSLREGSREADRLVPLAREVLSAARW